ncbi:MAG: Asp-tRNA(Asn)/Glu-tRNA(Gln) amidotransferase subunit GatB [Acidobacteria bacterium]|nr:MAG: Asp-tRNA(Asn)/Glu-tRNA(Gln) amidotransferase subunit GatB [Acidobacteriota bacterium]
MPVPSASAASSSALERYEPVIGLEVHVQLNTASKIFCGCANRFGAPPNSLTCPVCLGLPGALPVLNRAAVDKAMRAARGLNATVNARSIFARKNYFYPDLPKGYQISQYDLPLAEHGGLDVLGKRIGITRLHLEEDAGKNIHEGLPGSDKHSYVDLNRAGVPLVEIVSEPDMRSPEEAFEYLTRLKEIMLYLEVSDCNMEEGSLRCDANVSIRPRGQAQFGTKVEVKNLNSFRYLQRALEYEIERQAEVLDTGGRIGQETRLFQVAENRTASMRSKEHAHDYRYFPEPDLAPLIVSDAWRARVEADLPELPQALRERLQATYGLSVYDAQVLTASRALARYFEQAASGSPNPKAVANWIMGDLLAYAKSVNTGPETVGIPPAHIAELVALIDEGAISGKMAKDVFAAMLAQHEPPRKLVESMGMKQISDTGALDKIIDGVVAAHPQQVAQYRAGKTSLLAFFVGQVMKASRGQAAPALVNELLKKKLG